MAFDAHGWVLFRPGLFHVSVCNAEFSPDFKREGDSSVPHAVSQQFDASWPGRIGHYLKKNQKKCILSVTPTKLSGIPCVSTGHSLPKIDFHGVRSKQAWPVGGLAPLNCMSLHATAWTATSSLPSLAFASQELVDVSHQREIERLRNGGEHAGNSEDFTFYVILPLLLLLGLTVLGRRIIS